MAKNDSIKDYGTPLYQVNHLKVSKPRVTDAMRRDMKRFISKF